MSHTRPGTLYGVGMGPGDPALVTVGAVSILREAPVVAVPRAPGSEGPGAAFSIACRAVGENGLDSKEVVELSMPMTRDADVLARARSRAASSLADWLSNGLDVAFITLGDPLLYSTFSYLVPLVKALVPGCEIRTVPGVTSMCTSASASLTPLAEGDDRVAIIPATSGLDSVRSALETFDTVVLMKVNRKYDELVSLLREMDLYSGSVFASKVGWEGEELVTRELASAPSDGKVDYFSMIIVKTGRTPSTKAEGGPSA